MDPRISALAKPLLVSVSSAVVCGLAPECGFMEPLLAGIGVFLGAVGPNLISSEIERDSESREEAANYLRNQQVARHVGRVAGSLLAGFAESWEGETRMQLRAVADALPDFWLDLHSIAAPGISPLEGQQFIGHIAKVLAKADAEPALAVDQWQPVLAAVAQELPENDHPDDAILGYAACHLAQHLGEKLAVALTSSGEETQRVFRKVVLRFFGQLLLDQQAFIAEFRQTAAQQKEREEEIAIYVREIFTALTEWREAARKAQQDSPDQTLDGMLTRANRAIDTLERTAQELRESVVELKQMIGGPPH